MANEWRVEAYRTESGESPAQTFLDRLEKGSRHREALALIAMLRERGNELRRPHSAALGGGLFELRGRQVRLFYVFRGRRTAVLVDGMIKEARRRAGRCAQAAASHTAGFGSTRLMNRGGINR